MPRRMATRHPPPSSKPAPPRPRRALRRPLGVTPTSGLMTFALEHPSTPACVCVISVCVRADSLARWLLEQLTAAAPCPHKAVSVVHTSCVTTTRKSILCGLWSSRSAYSCRLCVVMCDMRCGGYVVLASCVSQCSGYLVLLSTEARKNRYVTYRPILGSRRAPGALLAHPRDPDGPRRRAAPAGRPCGRRGAPPAPPPPPDAHTCAHSTEQGQEPEAKREVMNENSGEREPRHGADYTKRRKSQLELARSSGAFRDNLDLTS
jgi:hypothetical protein